VKKQSILMREYTEVLTRRKWVIVLVLAATLAVAGVGSYVMTPIYSASTTVRIAPTQNSSMNGSIDYYWAAEYADRLTNTYIHLLRSRPFLKETIRRLDLQVTPTNLAKAIKVEGLPNAELLTITAKDSDPWLSAAIANTLGLLLVEEGQKIYSGPGKSAQEILQEQLARVESNLEGDRAHLQALLETQNESDFGKVGDLSARIETQEKTYAMLLEEYDDARLREAMLANSITVAEWALPPDDPSQPRPPINLALGALIGLVGGAGLAFLFEYLDVRIYSARNLAATMSVPVLGSVPSFGASERSEGGTVLLSGDAQCPAGEAFRVLRSILLSNTNGVCPKTLLITSAEPAAGKSTVLVNLAAAMARSGQKVIVVDSDFRRPCLHQVFGLANKVGLSNVILDPHSAATALHHTKVPGMRVLTSGLLPRYPAELLGSAGMQKVVTELANRADMVLFDSPPMLAVADTISLAHIVGGVLLVAARGETTGGQLRTALGQLDKVGAKTLGIILNKARLDDEDYAHYYHDQMTVHRTEVET